MNKNHQHIDALVRQRLQALPPATPPPGGWAALQRELDGDADLLLRGALTGLAAGTAPVGWEVLERKMDPQASADRELAERFNGLESTPPSGWPALAARLDRENGEAVDAIVTDGLARTAPAVSSGWAALAARLELVGWRRSTVAAWKLTECCLLLSLLLLFLRFGPTTPSNPTFAELTQGFPIPLNAVGLRPGAITATPVRETEVVTATPSEAKESVFLPAATAQAENSTSSGKTNARIIAQAGSSAGAVSLLPAPELKEFSVRSAITAPDGGLAEAYPLRPEVYPPAYLATLNIGKLANSLYPPSPALTLPRQHEAEPIYYYLNAFISPVDLNQVITPETEILEFDISSDRRITYGKSAGLMLDVVQGNSGLQLGFVYSRRSYIPTALKWWREDEFAPTELAYQGGYTRFIYDALELQFNYKRTLVETDKWRFSGQIGMGVNMVAYADFDDQERFVREFNDFLEWASNQPVSPEEQGGARSGGSAADLKQLKKPASGFLEGGGVFDNSSLYVNGGIVIERLISQRWSVYLAPTIGRAVYLRENQGIGPYKDRINPAGLHLGSRYHFGGK
jgi:hypothetical protein